MSKTKVKNKKLNLIAGLVVYNEEVKLKEWLDNHPFFPSVIVIDQSSTDKTAEIARADKRVNYILTNRFECIAEPDFKLLQQLAGANALIIISPDESISEEHYEEIRTIISSGFLNFRIRSYYIKRVNYLNDLDITDMFKNPSDPEGKDWQLRIALGEAIGFANVPHTKAKPLTEWAYIDSDKAWIVHRKTVEEERESMLKRGSNLSLSGKSRDNNHVRNIKKFLEISKKENLDG